MEKETYYLNPRKYWNILHDHFVDNCYITTKNNPPDSLKITLVVTYPALLGIEKVIYFLANNNEEFFFGKRNSSNNQGEPLKGIRYRFDTS